MNVNDFSAKAGDSYNLATDLIALTGTGESTVLYLKNTGNPDIVITSMTFACGAMSATITDDAIFTVIRNPTAGDLISDATSVDFNVNENHGSTKTLSADVYKGKQGGTITGGNSYGPFYVSPNARVSVPLTIRIPKDQSIGIKVDLNTSGGGNVYCALNCHTHDTTQL